MSLDVLDATISRVLFTGPSKHGRSGTPFAIIKLSGGQVAKGKMRKPEPGVRVRLWGEWQPQKGYDDPAFCFTSHEEVIDQSSDGVADYLRRHVDGLGVVKSLTLVESLGNETLTILRSRPEEALSVPGITEKIVEAIRLHFNDEGGYDPAAYARLIEMFKDHKVSRRVIEALLDDFGSNAPNFISEFPYQLLKFPRMTWKTVDAFALTTANYDPQGIARHKFAIVEAVEQISLSEGHTFAHRIDIESITFDLINCRPRDDAWGRAVDDKLIVRTEADEYALPSLAEAEESIAGCLARLSSMARDLPCSFDTSGLNEEQAEAMEIIAENGVAILAGSPGTGKSFTITKVLAALVGGGFRSIRIAAPTGKAAKRAAELLQGKLPPGVEIPCTTIHRLLGPKPNDADDEGVSSDNARVGRGRDGFTFAYGPDNHIPTDFLVIDEASMIDIKLGAFLLNAIAPGTRVVFVGDPNQLPSVGPGSMLRDMIDAGIPTAILTQIQRNSGQIVRACHAIKDGIVPEPAPSIDLETGNNWVHVELEDPGAIAQRVVDLHRKYRNFPDPLWDMQVVTPQKARLPIACDNLNRLLSEKLNAFGNIHGEPDADGEDDVGGPPEVDEGRVPFRRGDKVIRTKNGLCDLMVMINENEESELDDDQEPSRVDWRWDDSAWRLAETDIVNGDMGIIYDIVDDPKDTFVVVRFRTPDRLCRLSYDECHLSQAYAITCHKAQGSGFPFVIVPVHHSFYWDAKKQRGLFNREWIYTAISRSERMLITVGQFSAVRAAVGRKTVHRRKTRLVSLIRGHASLKVLS